MYIIVRPSRWSVDINNTYLGENVKKDVAKLKGFANISSSGK